MTFLSFWSFLRFRPGIGVLGPPRKEAPRRPLGPLYQAENSDNPKKSRRSKRLAAGLAGDPRKPLGGF